MSPSVEPFNEAKYQALMDGLEISEIRYSSVFADNRLDSEYVSKYYLKLQTALDKINTRAIADFAFVTDGIHASIDFDESSDINLISAKAPKNNYFDLSRTGYISLAQNANNSRTKLQENDVIVSTVGTIGNCAVVNKHILPANADRHVGIIRIRDPEFKPRYLSTFLLSEYGRSQSKRFTTGNVQPNLFIYKIKDIKVPLLSNDFQIAIERMVLHAEHLLFKSESCIQREETLLMRCFSNNFENKLFSIKTSSDSFMRSGRLDAEYYQPKYDALFDSLDKITTANLGGKNGLVAIRKSIEPGSDAYREEGIPFVRVSDINKFELEDPAIRISPNCIPDIESLYPRKDTILLSKDGSVGIAYKLEEDRQIVTSGALLHLTVKDTSRVLPDYLTLVLNSPIVQLQAERDCNGAIIQHWTIPDIHKVVIPILDMEKQKEIADKIRESFCLRKEAKLLLNKAVRAVEIAIEADEKTALSWIE